MNNPTAQILKKWQLMFNPVCSQPFIFEPSDNIGVSDFEEMDNDSFSMPSDDDNALLSDEEEPLSFGDSVVNTNDFEHFHEDATSFPNKAPPTASGYTSFTMSQKCLTSLMILLDSLECPNYIFEKNLSWARTCFLARFDFNPKCKKTLGQRAVDVSIHS
jgi:hypothetical protein